jgi:lipopolysaccharide assembly outer membrane protein LptD (OstA)
MKAALLVALVLGFTALGTAQTVAPTWLATADSMQGTDPSVVHLRGAVELKQGTIRITADEADMNTVTGEADLRGNVHMSTK